MSRTNHAMRERGVWWWHAAIGALAVCGCVTLPAAAPADTLTFLANGRQRSLEGNVLLTDAQQNLLFESRDSQQYIVAARHVVKWDKSAEPVPLLTKAELRTRLLEEFGSRFQVRQTKHYLICHSCDARFADEAGKLFEMTYARFVNYFRRQGGFKLHEPRQPLVAIICSSRREYAELAVEHLGALTDSTIGVYVPATNRMYMYNALDQGTVQALARAGGRNPSGAGALAMILKEQNISVIIHEAVHQIAFNCGFHDRNIRNPLWLVEGMAMYFETPDLQSKSGTGGLGEVNRERLEHYVRIAGEVTPSSLTRMIADDDAFRDPRNANDAYAIAWAYTYFLARTKGSAYMKYLATINARPLMAAYPAEDRLRDFRAAFGGAPDSLADDFQKYMRRTVERQRR